VFRVTNNNENKNENENENEVYRPFGKTLTVRLLRSGSHLPLLSFVCEKTSTSTSTSTMWKSKVEYLC